MKKFFIITAILMATISAAAQTDRAHTLKVYNWADYMDMDLIPEFEEYYEQETGEPVKIVYQTYDINENMLTEIEVGHEDYDVVCPSEYIIERMLRKGLLQKIDTNFVSTTENNFNNVSPWIREKLELISPSDTIRVADYAVGYFWGTTGFLYNKAYVDEDDVKSWGAIHNPKFQGQIFIKDAFRDVYSVMIQYAKYQDIEAGRADRQHLACDLSDENLKAVEDVLIAAKPQVAGWEADFGKDRVCQGKVWLNLTWAGDAQWALDEAEDGVELDYAIPEEGSNAWVDGWVIPIYAKNVKAASYFINFMCRSENALRNMEYAGDVSTIATPEVLDSLIDEEAYEPHDVSYFFGEDADSVCINYIQYPDKSVIDRCVLMRDAGDRNEALIEMWSRVKGNHLNWKMLTFIICVTAAVLTFVIIRKLRIYRRHKMRRKRLAAKHAYEKPI